MFYQVRLAMNEVQTHNLSGDRQLPYDHDSSSSVKMKGNCFIDIDGIYDYQLCGFHWVLQFPPQK
jgi:hypothetical protein